MEQPTILIALADDEALFRRGMRRILDDYADVRVVLEAENGQDLLDKLQASVDLPDVLLLDLKMPVMSGIEAARIVRERFPSMQIVVLSSHVNKAFIINMIELGASAYLGKNAHPDELAETIRAVHAKGFYYNQDVLEVIRESLTEKNTPKTPMAFGFDLTQREREVLQLLCEQFTTPEIADKLFISARTVDGHRNNLLSKLQCRNTAGLVVFAIQHKLVSLPGMDVWE